VIASSITVPIVWAAAPAAASCHHFTVSASPNPVAEGRTLTVTVSRDANLAPSHVNVSTVDETAKAGQDYTPLNRTVSFTNDVRQSFPVSVLSHATSEPARTFRLHLSNPGGCAINPNFVLDPDVRVTIEGHGATLTSAATVPSTTPASAVSASTAGSRATTSSAVTTAETTLPAPTLAPAATEAPTSTAPLTGQAQTAANHGGGGSGGTLVAIAVVAALAVGGGGFLLYRRRAS
jgi:hypothetical protein